MIDLAFTPTNDTISTTAEIFSEQCDSFLFTNIASNDDPAFVPDHIFAEIDETVAAQDFILTFFRYFERFISLYET